MQAMALDTHPTPTIRLIPATMVRTAIQATAMVVLITAGIGVRVDALRAEFTDDITAGTKGRSL
jgi:hypothetical protein